MIPCQPSGTESLRRVHSHTCSNALCNVIWQQATQKMQHAIVTAAVRSGTWGACSRHGDLSCGSQAALRQWPQRDTGTGLWAVHSLVIERPQGALEGLLIALGHSGTAEAKALAHLQPDSLAIAKMERCCLTGLQRAKAHPMQLHQELCQQLWCCQSRRRED